MDKRSETRFSVSGVEPQSLEIHLEPLPEIKYINNKKAKLGYSGTVKPSDRSKGNHHFGSAETTLKLLD